MFILNLIKSRYAWHSSTHGFLDIQYIVHFFIWKPMFSGYPKFEKHPYVPVYVPWSKHGTVYALWSSISYFRNHVFFFKWLSIYLNPFFPVGNPLIHLPFGYTLKWWWLGGYLGMVSCWFSWMIPGKQATARWPSCCRTYWRRASTFVWTKSSWDL